MADNSKTGSGSSLSLPDSLAGTDALGRKMPVSIEAEQSVLGSILIDPEAFPEVANIITSDCFYTEDHREIYLAMQELFLKSRSIDFVTLIQQLVERGVYKSDDEGRNYIKLLADTVPSAANVRDYAEIVHDKAMLRQLITVCGEITDSAFSGTDKTSAILENAEAKIFGILQGNERRGFTHIKDVLISVYDHLRELSVNPDADKGTPTGFSDLDKVLIGLGDSDLVLVGARPGMGKTSFAMNVATSAAMRTKKAVAVFSLEMSCDQLVMRMLSSEAMIDSYTLRTGALSPSDWTNLADAAGRLSETDIIIDDTTGMTVTGMKSKLRRVKNLGMVVIDYLQLMQADKRIDNRVQEVADISRNLKLLAKELHVPVITCAQLSRASESRPDKTPVLSDLRDSGAIEQDADIVLFLYRPEYYKDSGDEKSKDGEEIQNLAQVIVAKNRHGSTGKIDMGWFGQYTKFVSRSDIEEPPGAAQ